MKKLEKLLKKLEKEFEQAGPIRRERILRRAASVERKLNAKKMKPLSIEEPALSNAAEA